MLVEVLNAINKTNDANLKKSFESFNLKIEKFAELISSIDLNYKPTPEVKSRYNSLEKYLLMRQRLLILYVYLFYSVSLEVVDETGDDSDFEKRYKNTFHSISKRIVDDEHLFEKGQVPDYIKKKPEILVFNLEKNIENFIKFLNIDYDPPDDIPELESHLFTLLLYYELLIGEKIRISKNLFLLMDYITWVLLITAGSRGFHLEQIGHHFDRTYKSTKIIRQIKTKSKKAVLEEYYKIPNPERMKRHGLAKKIRENLSKIQKVPPSVKTIERYLKEEGLA